ncbi:ATP-dependent Clp protease ATP-binding subunit [Pseudoflavonifractor sp. 524-17]|uniref:AAA family ATPase n=1 Tax=Pseudoflavonifractor sp. 524-17 TaxID=2304577 RepID=UPI001379AB58|nr:AAA family ATPase [Pseudoflavonifractor sp. 524-17]NCE65514.1 ATP-dependent Clp protease ATP-binding subunit [Pseudoflavonifractor sp. 524-17]
MEFSQFCAAPPGAYDNLKRYVDGCACQGRSYEFSQCRLPAGCAPRQAALGFWQTVQGGYLLYFKPAVSYQGDNPQLARFFQQGSLQRFESFPALVACLRGLEGAQPVPAPPEQRQEARGPELFHRLSADLQAQVLGQRTAVEAAAFKLWGHLAKRTPARPLSLIFYGPTCVGKSELAKAITPALNRLPGERRYQQVWTELNSFTQAHSVYRLTGAPPGYVGYEDQPVFAAVRDNPCTVFLFDELDKAHPEVLKVFMSVLDEGRCAAHRASEQGERELDFRRCIFLFTTNYDLSAPNVPRLGFAPPEPPPAARETPILSPGHGIARRLLARDEAARQALLRFGVLREIAGRFSGLIGFQSLAPGDRAAVTEKQIIALGQEFGLTIRQVDPAIAQALTPEDVLSLRSTAAILEGALTPLFLAHAGRETAFCLTGTAEHLELLPAAG